MERHRCKLCYRSFANGRALGGHMRSHMMKFYAAKKSSEKQQPSGENLQESDDEFLSVHSYSTTSDEDDEEGFEAVVQDRESETGSFHNSFRRSKRVRKSTVSDFNEYEVLSSISDTTPEEHVAHCLIMLSRDKWNDNIEEKNETNNIIDDDRDDDYSEESGFVKVIKNSKNNKVRGKYRCETCNKLFKSYQALGGHRASHKKLKLSNSGGGSTAAAAAAAAVEEVKLHECPFCERVFTSGQALGGHKRSHFVGGSGVVLGNISRKNGESLNIDLNLPAPIDEDDDDEISQIAVSAVSDPSPLLSDQLLEN